MDIITPYLGEIIEKGFTMFGFNQDKEDAVKETGRSAHRSVLPEFSLGDSETARFFYWISPNFNMDMFIFLLPIMLIPAALIWIFVIYPPGKFYANVPFNRTDTITVYNATEGLFRKKRAYAARGVDPIPILLNKLE